ncbi:hypothetical protein ACJMK2_019851 [Sinanodonta woodiana]|uniref:Glutamine amidotransferase-like class 1 domain-containing protein 1 n=2 Tax=Sinanodonta woodiana TaxID=1069815 RepID=A0ABD3TZE8_SINWO
MAAPRHSCLFVLSSAAEGVSAPSFLQAYNLVSPNCTVQLASPNGRNIEYVKQDESNRRWFNEFRSKASSTPIGLETVDPARYATVFIPAAPGAVHDLLKNQDLAQIISHFVREKKPLCAVGMGVAGLFGAKKDNGSWCFEDYSLTGPSVFEEARHPEFASLSVIPEDFIKEHGGQYSSSEPDAIHVIIDRHVITGQNVQSTIMAVQNLILMSTQKYSN